jgi:hypothetical protein
MSNIRFPIDADGSLRAVRRRCRPLYALYAREPAYSTGRTDIEGRSFQSRLTLSLSNRAVTMDAIVLLSAGTLVVETKLATALCLLSQRRRNARSCEAFGRQNALAIPPAPLFLTL